MMVNLQLSVDAVTAVKIAAIKAARDGTDEAMVALQTAESVAAGKLETAAMESPYPGEVRTLVSGMSLMSDLVKGAQSARSGWGGPPVDSSIARDHAVQATRLLNELKEL